MEKPLSKHQYLKDWNEKLTDEWIAYAQISQSSHCRNISAHGQGVRYTEDFFHKIDELVLMHAFGAAPISGVPCSDMKKNFSLAQCRAAENVRNQILKYGKTVNPKGPGSTVTVQVIAVTLLLVECPEEPKSADASDQTPKKKEDKSKTDEKKLPGVSQVVVFRVLKPRGGFCFVDHTARYYADWKDYLSNNKLPRSKICFPRNGIYKYKQVLSSGADKNNNSPRFALDLVLAESKACSMWECAKEWSVYLASKAGVVAGVAAIIVAPFTGFTSIGAYAGYAAYAGAVAGWVSFGCTIIGTMATLGSLWDKYSHDESYMRELLSLAMIALNYGVAKYNASVLNKVKNGVPVTRMELAFMTVLNCVRFGVDSIMFVTNCVQLVLKACDKGLENITAEELLHFSMAAYYFGKTAFEPKTGYGIIKAAQRAYLTEEKRALIKDKGAQQEYDKLVGAQNLGDGSKSQMVKDDWEGFTCSQKAADELNSNAALIRNMNAIPDLNQFFLDVKDTNSSLKLTQDGKIMVNDTIEMHGSELNELNKPEEGVTGRRRRLLQAIADRAEADADQNKLFDNAESMTIADYNKQMRSVGERYNTATRTLQNMRDNEGMTFLNDILGPPEQTTDTPIKPGEIACPAQLAPCIPKSTATTTETVPTAKQSTLTPQKTRMDATQWISSTSLGVSSALYATLGLAKRPNTCTSTAVEDDAKNECICQSVKIPVVYANMRSINPKNQKQRFREKIERLKSLIDKEKPQLVAIVETWLKPEPEHKDEDVLGSLGLSAYEVFRQDRTDGQHSENLYPPPCNGILDRQGGGVLVLWKRDPSREISLVRTNNGDYADNIVNFDLKCKFNCKKCHPGNPEKTFRFVVVYRRPKPLRKEDEEKFAATNEEIVQRLKALITTYDFPMTGLSEIAVVGDFNWIETNKKHVEHLNEIISDSDCEEMWLSNPATHRSGNTLDRVFSSPWFVVNSADENLPFVEVTEFISDHAPLVFSLYLGKDSKRNEECESLRCFKRFGVT